jgi:hypothetical protein
MFDRDNDPEYGLCATEEVEDQDDQQDDHQDADESVTRSSDREHFSSSSTFLVSRRCAGLTPCCVALLPMPVYDSMSRACSAGVR